MLKLTVLDVVLIIESLEDYLDVFSKFNDEKECTRSWNLIERLRAEMEVRNGQTTRRTISWHMAWVFADSHGRL